MTTPSVIVMSDGMVAVEFCERFLGNFHQKVSDYLETNVAEFYGRKLIRRGGKKYIPLNTLLVATHKIGHSCGSSSGWTDGFNAGKTVAVKRKIQERIKGQAQRVRTVRDVPLRIRYRVLERDGGKCCLCGARERLQIDHIIPYSRGGETVMDNLRVLCADCNIGKGALMPNEAAA